MAKPPSQSAAAKADAAERLAAALADKPSGAPPRVAATHEKLSISLPTPVAMALRKRIFDNHQAGSGAKTLSALILAELLAAGWGDQR